MALSQAQEYINSMNNRPLVFGESDCFLFSVKVVAKYYDARIPMPNGYHKYKGIRRITFIRDDWGVRTWTEFLEAYFTKRGFVEVRKELRQPYDICLIKQRRIAVAVWDGYQFISMANEGRGSIMPDEFELVKCYRYIKKD